MNLDKRIKRKYHLENYDPAWIEKFEQIKNFLQLIFKEKALKIEHVGSTSIPGMKAKPIIDTLIVVEKIEDFSEEKKAMVDAGYKWGENYIAPNTLIFFKTSSDGSKTENIHVCEAGSPKERQFLVMRDFFRTFPEKAKEYANVKERSHLKHPDDYPAYRKAKSPFLQQIEQEAYIWHKNII